MPAELLLASPSLYVASSRRNSLNSSNRRASLGAWHTSSASTLSVARKSQSESRKVSRGRGIRADDGYGEDTYTEVTLLRLKSSQTVLDV